TRRRAVLSRSRPAGRRRRNGAVSSGSGRGPLAGPRRNRRGIHRVGCRVDGSCCFLLASSYGPPHAAFLGSLQSRDSRELFLAPEQAENWGRPLGGADFLLARTGGGFRPPREKAVWRQEGAMRKNTCRSRRRRGEN